MAGLDRFARHGKKKPGLAFQRVTERSQLNGRIGATALIATGLAAAALLLTGVLIFVSRPTPEVTSSPAPSTPPSVVPQLRYRSTPIGALAAEFARPWVSNVQVVDLDRDGLVDVLYCEAQKNSVRWIRQSSRGVFTEMILAEEILGPVHVWAADLNGTGRLDVLVASMGQLQPMNDPIGAVYVLENVDNRHFTRRTLLEHVARVTDVRAANLAGHTDGRLDLIVGQFGYDQGETRWMENQGDWKFESHVVNTQSGTIHTPAADFDGDGKVDFASLVSQEWEEVHWFKNLGEGRFKDTVIWGARSEDYGSSGLGVADLNQDGKPDLLYTNGDGFDYSVRGPRPWHGVQWIENRGGGEFRFHRIGDFPGAFGPTAVDLDGNGTVDILAVSGFSDWSNPEAPTMMAWLNDGRQNFTPLVLARSPTHIMTVAAGDLDGNGVPVIVTGCLYATPTPEDMSSVLLWRRQ